MNGGISAYSSFCKILENFNFEDKIISHYDVRNSSWRRIVNGRNYSSKYHVGFNDQWWFHIKWYHYYAKQWSTIISVSPVSSVFSVQPVYSVYSVSPVISLMSVTYFISFYYFYSLYYFYYFIIFKYIFIETYIYI